MPTRDPSRPNGRSDAAFGVVLAVVVMVGIAAANMFAAPDTPVFLGMLAIGPFVAAAFAPAWWTAGVGVIGVGLAFFLGASGDMVGTFDHLFRAVAVSLAGIFAVWVAHRRESIQASLVRVRRVAEVAQAAILAPVDDTVGGVRVATRYRSAAAEAVVGGDFYDVVPTGHGRRVVIGDVRGKGLPAVRLSARTLNALRAVAHVEADLAAVVKTVEATMSGELDDEEFVSMAVAEFGRDGRVRIANCGHPAPLRWRQGAVEQLVPSETTPPIGLGATPQVDEFEFRDGDRLLLYTDGVVEARDEQGAFFDLETAFAADAGRQDPGSVLDGLLDAVGDHAAGDLADDIALVLASAERRPAGDTPLDNPVESPLR